MGKTREFLDGRVAVVTGVNTGLGLEIARGLALMRATVVLACRSAERGEAARRELVEDSCNDRIESMQVDLGSQASVRAFAGELAGRHPQVHVLVNNAAVWPDRRVEGPDGIEQAWATNVLGPFLLTNLLLDALRAGRPARVVNVASGLAGGLDLDDVQFRRRSFSGRAAYAQSKQALRMLTRALDARHEGQGVTFNAVHPGLLNTGLESRLTGLTGAVRRPYVRLFGRSPALGSETPLWVATADENERSSGNYWVDRKIRRETGPFKDEAAIDRLWNLCTEMTAPRG